VDDQVKHQRRKRYSGTYPKTYETRYKELNPNQYQETIQKVIQKGNTPAGMHRPICVNEILSILDIKPGHVGLDATLGYGGHTQAMLEKLNYQGHVYALDQDPIELPKTKQRLEALGYGSEILTTLNFNFKDLDSVIVESGPLDFILADLGVSSMQIDNPSRGFSYKTEGPLDLRMNPNVGIPAHLRLLQLTADELEGMLIENADEPYAKHIAIGIRTHLESGHAIETTTDLSKIIASALKHLPMGTRAEEIKKSSQRTFQALRIDVNQEFDVLYEFLEKVPHALKSGGKVAILSFHSGEDRLVKKSFQYYFRQGIYQEIADEFIRPTLEEQTSNSRARSAKLRYAIKK
jgi:16S rRNA (cytosine1402-N4)-methyltransferase